MLEDVRSRGLRREAVPEIYIPREFGGRQSLTAVVRSSLPPSSLLPSIRNVVREIDPSQPLDRVLAMTEIMASTVGKERNSMILLTFSALFTVLLAMIGVYALVAYTVSTKIREFGVRLALGATPVALAGAVSWQGLRWALIGVILGWGISLLVGETLGHLLYEVSEADLPTLLWTSLALLVTTLLACAAPAFRAGRTDPATALRENT